MRRAYKPEDQPLFVGGTGRSGTTIVGTLIGHSEHYKLIPIEVRFHVDQGGLSDLLDGRVDVDEFIASMMTRWYSRPADRHGRPRGLHVLTERKEFDAALNRLRRDFERDPRDSANRLIRDLLDPVAQRANKPSWVEMSPPVARAMDSLARVLPNALFVHMIRDGRDVAASVVRRKWGPGDLPSAIQWWADELISIARAESQVDPDRMLRLRIESLVGPRRGDALARLCEFLGIVPSADMRAFFDERVTSSKAHLGRWRHNLEDAEIAQVNKHYEIALARLAESGVFLPSVD